MSARTGLTAVEVAVLAAVGRYDDPIRTSVVLAELDAAGVIGPRAGYPVMHDLQRSWRRHLPLLRGEGNWGSQGNDAPADPEYTEVTLTPAGRLAAAPSAGIWPDWPPDARWSWNWAAPWRWSTTGW